MNSGKYIMCPVCGGTGQFTVDVMMNLPCLNCFGEGRVFVTRWEEPKLEEEKDGE